MAPISLEVYHMNCPLQTSANIIQTTQYKLVKMIRQPFVAIEDMYLSKLDNIAQRFLGTNWQVL